MMAIGPKNKIGTMPIGAQKNCTTRMSTVCSREIEKARKARKERKEKMMKEKASQVMAKASRTMFSQPLHQINKFKINFNKCITRALCHQTQVMVLFHFLKLIPHVLMYFRPSMIKKKFFDALAEEVKMPEILGQQQTRKRRRMILCM